jgi:hypothetical protein
VSSPHADGSTALFFWFQLKKVSDAGITKEPREKLQQMLKDRKCDTPPQTQI